MVSDNYELDIPRGRCRECALTRTMLYWGIDSEGDREVVRISLSIEIVLGLGLGLGLGQKING